MGGLRAPVWVILLTMLAAVASADTLDGNVSSDSVRATFSRAFQGYQRDGTPYFDAGLLYSGDTDALMGHAGLTLSGDTGARNLRLQAALGGRLYYVDSDPGNGAALGVGGNITASLPRFDRFALRGHAYLAPDVLAFQDLKQLFEYGVDLQYQVLRDGYVYVGYRQVRARVSGDGHRTLDSGAHIGVRFNF